MAEVEIRDRGAALGSGVDLDDGVSYHLDWVETEWGVANQPEPQEELASEGVTLFEPLDQSWERRIIRLAGFVE